MSSQGPPTTWEGNRGEAESCPLGCPPCPALLGLSHPSSGSGSQEEVRAQLFGATAAGPGRLFRKGCPGGRCVGISLGPPASDKPEPEPEGRALWVPGTARAGEGCPAQVLGGVLASARA